MSRPWYYQEWLTNDRHAELLREAQNERRAREARGELDRSPILPTVFEWLKVQISSLRQQFQVVISKRQRIASRKFSYLENPDPFKNCVTC